MIKGLIQTDAAISPDNSGGSRLDSSGRSIGVNPAIFSPSGASSGIGFAVPVDLVKRVLPQLIANEVHRPPSLAFDLIRGSMIWRTKTGLKASSSCPSTPLAQPKQLGRNLRNVATMAAQHQVMSFNS